MLPLLVSTIRLDVSRERYAALAAARALSLLVDGYTCGQEEVRCLGGIELLVIAARPHMPAEIKMTKSEFSSAAADALDSLCKNNKLNTQAVKDGQEKEWQNLTDSIVINPLNLNSEKNTVFERNISPKSASR